jgi:hypothetical protein
MYCCQPLQNKIADAGQRGSAIIVGRAQDGLGFWLQTRGVAVRDEPMLRSARPLKAIVNISGSQRIAYCPWCGRPLAELIAAAPEAFRRLADLHEPYAPGPL